MLLLVLAAAATMAPNGSFDVRHTDRKTGNTTSEHFAADRINPKDPESVHFMLDKSPFQVRNIPGTKPSPCGKVISLAPWGSPPPGVHEYLAKCSNGKAYAIAQEDSTGYTHVAEAVKKRP
jgi:hypothetical protein